MARERILLCPLDDVETGRMVGMGASGFLHPDFLEAALASPAAELRLMNFFRTPHCIDMNNPGTMEAFGSFTEAWNFCHRGFALREI